MLVYFPQSTLLDSIAPTVWMRKQGLKEAVICHRCPGISESGVCSEGLDSKVCSGFTLPVPLGEMLARARGQPTEGRLA